jgi:hypothetical protein
MVTVETNNVVELIEKVLEILNPKETGDNRDMQIAIANACVFENKGRLKRTDEEDRMLPYLFRARKCYEGEGKCNEDYIYYGSKDNFVKICKDFGVANDVVTPYLEGAYWLYEKKINSNLRYIIQRKFLKNLLEMVKEPIVIY